MKVHCMRGKGGELIVGNPRRVDFQKDRDKGKQCQCKRLDKLWDQIWALGSQKWDFGVKNEFFLKQNSKNMSQLAMASWRRVGVTSCVSTRHGE
ncbi:hypothetical protein MTR_3g462770 [Medicago truncatula]|uniref:Uncharacterized protein n=1 Tax=Medicago truncatula TaxID=3880 RepID=A0A072UXL4_MEDTR|nr:hypothetical protein MTR_3g462770 [Medicago truncatula]